MMGDFIVTAMYFGASFSATATLASKVMIWLFGVWIWVCFLPIQQDPYYLKEGN